MSNNLREFGRVIREKPFTTVMCIGLLAAAYVLVWAWDINDAWKEWKGRPR